MGTKYIMAYDNEDIILVITAAQVMSSSSIGLITCEYDLKWNVGCMYGVIYLWNQLTQSLQIM